jgi:serine/threonine protein kinase
LKNCRYRSPEVIVGAPYDTSTDVWSIACLVFELVTGDYLFDPKEDEYGHHSRDEDHLALIIELLGAMPERLTQTGKYSKQFFTSRGQLRNIQSLDSWGLEEVLLEKYKLPKKDAQELAGLILPMLELDPDKRGTCFEALCHPIFDGVRGDYPCPVLDAEIAAARQGDTAATGDAPAKAEAKILAAAATPNGAKSEAKIGPGETAEKKAGAQEAAVESAVTTSAEKTA